MNLSMANFMRYTYTLEGIGEKFSGVTTNIQNVFHDLQIVKPPWVVYVTDNMTGLLVNTIHSKEALEEWAETAARNITWSDKADKEKLKEKLIAKMKKQHDIEAKGIECPSCKHSWNPFDPDETGIKLKGTFDHTKVKWKQSKWFPNNDLDTSWKEATGETMSNEKFAARLQKQNLIDKNLKTAAAVGKPTFQAIPLVALVALGKAMQNGEDKYERYNWREAGSTSSVFFNAMLRHLVDWWCGEDYAQDSGIHHLAHLMAGCAIVLDSELHGKLSDDRDKKHVKLLHDMVDLIVAKA